MRVLGREFSQWPVRYHLAAAIAYLVVLLVLAACARTAPPAPAEDAPVCIDGKCAVPGMKR